MTKTAVAGDFGDDERKGASYSIKATRSHDYGQLNPAQSPHHTNTIPSIHSRSQQEIPWVNKRKPLTEERRSPSESLYDDRQFGYSGTLR